MKRLLLASITMLALSGLVAFAAEEAAPASKPETKCATLPECQKKVDDLSTQVSTLTIAFQGATQQRDIANKAKADQELQAFVTSNVPPPKK